MANRKVKAELQPICDRIAEVRQRSNLTQQEFAELLGTTRASISAIEAGYYTPSFQIMRGIKKKLNVPYEFILDGSGGMNNDSELERCRERNKKLEEEMEIYKLAISALKR